MVTHSRDGLGRVGRSRPRLTRGACRILLIGSRCSSRLKTGSERARRFAPVEVEKGQGPTADRHYSGSLPTGTH